MSSEEKQFSSDESLGLNGTWQTLDTSVLNLTISAEIMIQPERVLRAYCSYVCKSLFVGFVFLLGATFWEIFNILFLLLLLSYFSIFDRTGLPVIKKDFYAFCILYKKKIFF